MLAPAEDLLKLGLHPKIRQMIGYWLSIRPAGGPSGLLPGRQHFNPMSVPKLLSNLWLIDVEREPRLRFHYRLIGTAVANAFARDFTGRYLDEAHPEFSTSQINAYLRQVLDSGLASWRSGRPLFFALHDFLHIERVYLPAARDGVHIDMVFALTIFLSRFGEEF